MTFERLYPFARPALFSLDAETAHHLTLENLRRAHGFGSGDGSHRGYRTTRRS